MALMPAPKVRLDEVVMFGQFQSRDHVDSAFQALNMLSRVPITGDQTALRDVRSRYGVPDLTSEELVGLANDCSWNVTGTTLVVRTLRQQIQAASKVMLSAGAKIEIYSSERFPHALW